MFPALLTLAAVATAAGPLEDRTIGVGIGTTFEPITFESSLPRIDRFSLHVQLTPKVAIVPTAIVSFDRYVDQAAGTSEVFSAGAGLGARWYAASRGPVHLVGLATAEVARTSSRSPFDDETTMRAASTSTEALAGLGVEWTPSSHFALALDAQNPLFHLSRTRTSVDDDSWQSTTWGAALALDPRVTASAHLYF